MKKPVYIIILFFLLCFSIMEGKSQKRSSFIRFGLIADIQYGDCDTKGSRFYRNSLQKLDSCIMDFNQKKVDFIINLGDLVDRNPQDIPPVISALSRAEAPVYNITGNHDYNGIENNSDLYTELKMPHEYYALTLPNWRFILLNTNEIATYANISGTWKEQELNSQLEKLKKEGKTNGQTYNGGISSCQLNWLKEQLLTAQNNHEKVIIFSHHPLYPASAYTALNDKEILDALSGYSCVKAVISGHHHTGGFGYYNHIPCITTEGMIETENINAYGIIEIYEDKMIVDGTGRTKSYEILFDSPTHSPQ